MRKLLKQRMEEFNGCIDLIVEERQRVTESLALELAKIDKDMRENSINIIEIEKLDFNGLLQRVGANREIVIKRGEVRNIVREVMSQREQLVVDEKKSTTESDDSLEDAELESTNNESDSEESKQDVDIPSYSPMSPDTEVIDSESVVKKMNYVYVKKK